MVELVCNHDSGNAIIKFSFRYQNISLTEYIRVNMKGKDSLPCMKIFLNIQTLLYIVLNATPHVTIMHQAMSFTCK